MTKKSNKVYQEVKHWVEDILDFCFGEFAPPRKCPSILTNLVFIKIEVNPILLNKYNSFEQIIGKESLNKLIGKHIKTYWNLKNGKQSVVQNRLIGSYTKHFN